MATRAKRENERDQDRPAYHYPTTRTFGGEKKKKKNQKYLENHSMVLSAHHILSTTREIKPKTEKAKERGEGEGRGREE